MPSSQIIVPIDVSTELEAIALIDKLPEVSFWKVGLELFVSTGANVVKILKERQKKVFLDLKLHDIPNTVAGASRAAARYGVDLLTIHSTCGAEALTLAHEAIQQGALESGVAPTKLIAITVLTSLSSRQLAFELKIPLELPEYALNMALMAQESGLEGAVCSPQEVKQLKDSCGKDFLLVCPGVRPTWAKSGDQKRSMTPAQAIANGADYLVIGRPITAADDPKAAWQRICDEIPA